MIAKDSEKKLLNRIAKIGYEKIILKTITLPKDFLATTEKLNVQDFEENPDKYTIVDIRNTSEIDEGKIFESALPHPLNELRDTASNIPTDKPIVVHCAGGYRSAAGSSILQSILEDVTIYDLSDDVKKFQD